jgi:hypothetical protein
MAEELICGTEFWPFFNGTIVPLTAIASLTASVLIAITYKVGNAMANARMTLWAKTEAFQLAISVVTLVFIYLAVTTMCGLDMREVANIFGVTAPSSALNVYDAAQEYLNEAALYSHNALTVVRYHLEGYTVLSYLNAFECDFNTGAIGWGCLFGYSGANLQPVGGYGALTAALNVFFNSTIIAHFTALNYIFILMFVYRGFVFLFLPLGVLLRSLPYLRSMGALFIALALSFLLVYPLMLGVFYLMRDTLVNANAGYTPLSVAMSEYDERVYPDKEGWAAVGQALITVSSDQIKGNYFSSNGALCNDACDLEDPEGAIKFAAYAFVAAVFLPTVALLAAIASVGYLARLYGEEIDLSRLTQLV